MIRGFLLLSFAVLFGGALFGSTAAAPTRRFMASSPFVA